MKLTDLLDQLSKIEEDHGSFIDVEIVGVLKHKDDPQIVNIRYDEQTKRALIVIAIQTS